MNIAICVSGVNDKNSIIVDQLKLKISGVNFYYLLGLIVQILISKNIHDRLFTMHYPKMALSSMEVKPPSSYARKYGQYVKPKELFDDPYFGIAPTAVHADI